MSGKHLVLRGDARRIPLADGSVALIVTSPPYWAQRSYRDAGGHYDGQIGSEPHPRHWLDAMYEVMKECWRVLAPGGSVFVNLGDKRAGSGGHNNSGVSKSKGSGSGLSGGPQYSHKPLAREGGPTGATSILTGRSHTTERDATRATRRNAPDRYEQAHFGRRKSRQLLPERFAIGCEDGLADPEGIGWIVRQVIVWQKANGLPESITDRTRDDFEYILHLTKSERYFAAIDEIREPHVEPKSSHSRKNGDHDAGPEAAKKGSDGVGRNQSWVVSEREYNPLGKVPGSVWRISSEPLRIPDYFVHDDRRWRMWGDKPYGKPRQLKDDEAPEGLFALSDIPKGMKVVPELVGLWRYVERRLAEGYEGPIMVGWVDHFAAFPTELPRRLVLGFSPSGICTACNEPRRPVIEKRRAPMADGVAVRTRSEAAQDRRAAVLPTQPGREWTSRLNELYSTEATIAGYACRCSDASAPTRNAVVLDVFGGTGTTALVAETLGRTGVSLDLSEDYCRLARWRIESSGHGAKAEQETWKEAQGTML